MEMLIAIALVIIVIAIILAGREKSRDVSDKDLSPFEPELHSASKPASDASDKDWCSFESKLHIELHSKGKLSKPEPFDYGADEWKVRSRQLREQAQWRCQACNLSLYQHKHYLHTHHIWGTRYNNPKNLRALCIGCHSEQPGGNHYLLKGTRDYQGFMKRYGKKWRRESSEDLKRDYSETKK
ncbi:hypothetical protein C6499_20345 [Candidatus Poribacteria bacterium]|nr:MAG: hypothetical protein C6499_20345 [Candidatus Poribacteria bacterium]